MRTVKVKRITCPECGGVLFAHPQLTDQGTITVYTPLLPQVYTGSLKVCASCGSSDDPDARERSEPTAWTRGYQPEHNGPKNPPPPTDGGNQ